MEYLALIELLKAHGPRLLIARTDSELLQKTAMVWRKDWKARNWKNGKVKNLDLVQELDALLDQHPVQVEWVRGHNGDTWNEYADGLAERAVRGIE
jgi:ribonuclease HI